MPILFTPKLTINILIFKLQLSEMSLQVFIQRPYCVLGYLSLSSYVLSVCWSSSKLTSPVIKVTCKMTTEWTVMYMGQNNMRLLCSLCGMHLSVHGIHLEHVYMYSYVYIQNWNAGMFFSVFRKKLWNFICMYLLFVFIYFILIR